MQEQVTVGEPTAIERTQEGNHDGIYNIFANTRNKKRKNTEDLPGSQFQEPETEQEFEEPCTPLIRKKRKNNMANETDNQYTEVQAKEDALKSENIAANEIELKKVKSEQLNQSTSARATSSKVE